MTKALITADLHLSANPRDSYRFNFMERVPRLLTKYGCELLLVLGDLTENKDYHGAELVNRIADYFKSYTAICPVLITRGNHDGTDPNHPFYQFLKHIAGITWVNSPTEELGDSFGPAIYLPHTSNYKKDWAEIDFDKYRWVFAHNTFSGAQGEFGHILDGIPLDVFPADARVISGDIHVPQKIGCVRYVGAPFCVDFGDSYDPRCLLLEGDKVSSIKLGGPQKRLVTGDVTVPKGQPVYKGVDKCKPGDILKVRLTINRALAPHWPECKAAVREWGNKHGFIIDTVQPIITELNQLNKDRSTHKPKRTDEQLMLEYAKARGLDELTIKTGMKFI